MLAAALAAATAIALAAPAYADTTDQQFLAALDKAGIAYQSPSNAIAGAKRVCAMMGDGKSAFEVVDELTKADSGVTTAGAFEFTEIAVGAYCPKEVKGSGK